jgi:hypothetical protein
MDSNQVRENINCSMSQWHLINSDKTIRPLVCILCDRFIFPDSNKHLSLDKLTQMQFLFYPNSDVNIVSASLASCYRIPLPDAPICNEVKRDLKIDQCLLSPRSSYVLLNENGDGGYNLCNACNAYINKNQRPKFCIANNYCFGSPPPCLLNLTDVELATITTVRTYGYTFCYTGGQKHKLCGTLSYYKVEKDTVVRSIANLDASKVNIAIIIEGDITKQQYKRVRNKQKLRVPEVSKAIGWLLENNSEWSSVNLNYEEL